MLLKLILTVCMGVTCVLLADKWQIDNWLNTNRYTYRVYRYWPKDCTLCRGFWYGALYAALSYIPYLDWIIIPFAAIPFQLLLMLLLRKLNGHDKTKT